MNTKGRPRYLLNVLTAGAATYLRVLILFT